MDSQLQLKTSELFVNVSEQEQEVTVGGFAVRFGNSQTYINSYASNKFNGSIGNLGFSESSQSSYTLWQSTNLVEFDFGDYYSRPGRKVPFLDLLSRFVFSFLSSF